MNVTLRIDDELGKAAKHCAIDAGMSLSKWVAEQLRIGVEQAKKEEKSVSLAEAMQNDIFEGCEKEMDFENSQWESRKTAF